MNPRNRSLGTDIRNVASALSHGLFAPLASLGWCGSEAIEKEAELHRVWDQLRRLALHSVKEYFQEGGDGSKIPQPFQANNGASGGGLNNFSLSFWNDKC